MARRQSCAEKLVRLSGLEKRRTPTKETVAHATKFAAKDLSSHCRGAGREILELRKWEMTVIVESVECRRRLPV